MQLTIFVKPIKYSHIELANLPRVDRSLSNVSQQILSKLTKYSNLFVRYLPGNINLTPTFFTVQNTISGCTLQLKILSFRIK